MRTTQQAASKQGGKRAEPVMWVTLGMRGLGEVYEAGCRFEAVTAAGESLGRFDNANEAADAIRRARQ
ncbi:hypothetical protein [Afifella sp. YEN Y35]|uniref:hypothetical protein n=1 Tax=Afifella sp. YEN Y35 TaxID=3388337 RepID=UPI0039E1AB65